MTDLQDRLEQPPVGEESAFIERVRIEAASLSATGERLWTVYRLCRALSFVGMALIPVLAAGDADRWTMALTAGVVIVVEGWLQLNRYHEQAMRRRAVAEALYSELDLYQAQVQDYIGQHRFRRLVERVTRLRDDFSRKNAEAFEAGGAGLLTGRRTLRRTPPQPAPQQQNDDILPGGMSDEN